MDSEAHRAMMRAFDIVADELAEKYRERGATSALLTISFGLAVNGMGAETSRFTGNLLAPVATPIE